MLDDKFVEYISGIKSPFEEEDIPQEEITYDGYMQYFRDCMLKSIGTKESSNQFLLYWKDFLDSCTEQQKNQFIQNCLNRVIKHYQMSFLSSMLTENEYSEKELEDLIFFFVYKRWLKYFPKCLSYIHEKILNNDEGIKVFINSDYDSFVDKLQNCKSCSRILREYFKFCCKDDGIKTLYLTLNDDRLGNYVEQYKLQKRKTGELKNDDVD